MEERASEERAKGALLGAFVGDALGLGPHWYYDLEEMRADYGDWITDYADPQPDRYHGGMKAGDWSQAGYILALTTRSLVENGGYEESDFCRRMDEELFAKIDGKPMSGPGGYTSQSIREAYEKRVKQGKDWGEIGGLADTTEAIERTLALAIRYAGDPKRLAEVVAANTALTQTDATVQAMTVAYGSILGLLLRGHPFDGSISRTLMGLVKGGELPFHAVTRGELQPPEAAQGEASRVGKFASPDALLMPSYMARAAGEMSIQIEPAWKASLVYGMPCAIYMQLPSAYYLASRFADDFEEGVLQAINGGGQNQARAMMVGALIGAQVGFSRIPERWIEGLREKEEILGLAERLAADAVAVDGTRSSG